MEYSVADSSEVQWVSTVLLQFLTVVYAWNNTCLKKQRLTKWSSFKPVVIVKEEAWRNPQTQVFHPRKFYKNKGWFKK